MYDLYMKMVIKWMTPSQHVIDLYELFINLSIRVG